MLSYCRAVLKREAPTYYLGVFVFVAVVCGVFLLNDFLLSSSN